MQNRYFLKLIIWLLIIKACAFIAFQYAGIGLMPDEAQYWTWSEVPAFGYYSKPPGVAWEIGFGTLFFGNTELGVRFGALLLSFALSLSIYFLARSGGLERRYAFWSSIVFSLTPLGLVSSNLATTDCGFGLFWTLAAAYFVRALVDNKDPESLKIGLLVACGALFKWTTYLLWLPMIVFMIWQRKFTLRFVGGILLSAIALLPTLIWNMSHDYATFHHVFRSVAPLSAAFHGNCIQFLAAQVILISPIIFVLLVIAALRLCIHLRQLPLSICFYWWTSVAMFVAVTILACFKKVQGNWAVMSYFTAFPMLLATAAMSKESFLRWIKGGLVVSVILIGLAIGYEKKMPYKLIPYRDGLGWERLENGLLQLGYDPATQFLFADRYQTTSLLSFYGPKQKRAYFFNLHGVRKNQFSYWAQMSSQEVGKTGFFVVIIEGPNSMQRALEMRERIKKELQPYFATIADPFIIIPLYETNQGIMKVALIIKAENYNGNMPPEVTKY